MTGHCPACDQIRNMEKITAKAGVIAWRCKHCSTVIPVKEKETDD